MKLSFKLCTLEDLDVLTELSRTTFITAFEKDNNPKDFKNYIEKAFNKDTIKAQLLNPNSTFYFAYYNNEIVGYFKLNENDAQNEQFNQSSMELERIYVLSAFQGKQIGKQMLIKIIDITQAKRVAFIWLGVWQKNTEAVRFYDRFGFKKFDSHPYYIGKDKQIDWLMRLDLA
jgi:ribosomal protein S18 acetylase RimI-like enzyme